MLGCTSGFSYTDLTESVSGKKTTGKGIITVQGELGMQDDPRNTYCISHEKLTAKRD